VLYLVPQSGPGQGLLDPVRHVAAIPVELEPEGHVVEDTHLERVGLLEHHADVAAEHHGIDVTRIDILPVEVYVPLEAEAVDEVVHAVEASQDRALAAARGSDEASDLALLDGHVAVAHGQELAVEDLLEVAVDDDLFLPCHLPVARRIVEISNAFIPEQASIRRVPFGSQSFRE